MRELNSKSETTDPVATIEVGAGKGVILIQGVSGSHSCYFLEEEDCAGFDTLFDFSDAEQIKFVGDIAIYRRLLKTSPKWVDKASRVIDVQGKNTEIKYISDEGRIQIPDRLRDRRGSGKLVSQESPEKKKRVLIVDDSPTILKILTKIVDSSDTMETLATASRPSEARAILEKEKPDLITLDVHMPEMTGVEFLKQELTNRDIPVVMITSVSKEDGPLVMEALSAGATAYIQKPSLSNLADLQNEIVHRLETASRSKFIKHTHCVASEDFKSQEGVIAIGSSTGGTNALQDILVSLPKKIPPILIVQHIPPFFSKALADQLNRVCPFKVVEASFGDVMEKDTVYIAPGDKQMKVRSVGSTYKITVNDDPPVGRFKPSVDYLFDSVAKLSDPGPVVGVILTGMGQDGAKGLLQMKNAGARTIGQDRESSVVYGMPKAAKELGAVELESSLAEIPRSIVRCFNKMVKGSET